MTTDLVCVADVAAEPVRWLWPGRIPLGKLTVLDGDPGMGKSTLTLTITAKVSTGLPFPDGVRPELADVILLSAEDDIGDTIRPRLEAAGADVNRVFVLPDVQEEDKPPRPPELPLDLDRLEAMVKERAAALVVIDPLMAFLSGVIDAHRDQDVRRALAPVAYMAARSGAAVLIVRHMNKSGGANPLYRGGGSIGIVGAARAGLLAAPDPDDDSRRILAVTKSNLAVMPEALAYRLVPAGRLGVAKVVWEGATEHTAADLLAPAPHVRPAPKQEEAEAFLRRMLASEAKPVTVLQKAAKGKGISWDTIKRAKEGLPIVVFRKGEEGRRGGGSWWWRLDPDQLQIKEGTPQHSPDTPLNPAPEPAGQDQDSEAPEVKEIKESTSLAPTGQPWPSREEWAKHHRTVYYDSFDVDSVSRKASDYATADEITGLVYDLRVRRNELGKPRPIDDDRQELRRRYFRAAKLLEEDQLPRMIGDGVTLQLLQTLLGRYQATVDAAQEEARERIESRPVDDTAWQKELERRAKVDAYFASDPVVQHGVDP